MNWIIPGFPSSNPILSGLAFIAQGGDVERALLQRDELLSNPQDFVSATWEALAWLPPESPLVPDLLTQGGHAWLRLSQEQRADFFCKWSEGEQLKLHQQEAIQRWGEAC